MRLVFLFVVFVPGLLLAEAMSVAVVDMQQVITTSEIGRNEQGKLNKELENHKSKLKTKQMELETMKAGVQKQAGVLSQEALNSKLEQIKAKDTEIQRALQDFKDELQVKNNSAISKLMIKVKEAIEAISKERNIDLVLEKNINVVAYSNDAVDITSKVIDKLDR